MNSPQLSAPVSVSRAKQAGFTYTNIYYKGSPAIAAAIGVHASTVYRWARDQFRPTAHRMITLAALAA